MQAAGAPGAGSHGVLQPTGTGTALAHRLSNVCALHAVAARIKPRNRARVMREAQSKRRAECRTRRARADPGQWPLRTADPEGNAPTQRLCKLVRLAVEVAASRTARCPRSACLPCGVRADTEG